MEQQKSRGYDGGSAEALRGWELIFQSRTDADVSSACAPFSLPFNFFDPSRRKETFLAQSIGRLRKCQMRCIERRNDKLSYTKRQNELYYRFCELLFATAPSLHW